MNLDDTDGNTLLRIQERKLRLRDTMEIEDANGRTVATVKKAQEADRTARCRPSSGGRHAGHASGDWECGRRVEALPAGRGDGRGKGEGGVHPRERNFTFAGFRGAVGGGDEVLGDGEVLLRVHATNLPASARVLDTAKVNA